MEKTITGQGPGGIALLKPTANWSPYIFTLVQKLKHRVYKIHVFK